MNLKIEEILMVIVAFLIGWFLRTMIKGVNNNNVNNNNVNNNNVKKVGGKHNYVRGNNNKPGHEIPNRNLRDGGGCHGNPSNKVYSESETPNKQASDNSCYTSYKDMWSCQGEAQGSECEWFTARPDCACKDEDYRVGNNRLGNRRCENYIEGDNNQPCAEKGAVATGFLNMRGSGLDGDRVCSVDNECSKGRKCEKYRCVNK